MLWQELGNNVVDYSRQIQGKSSLTVPMMASHFERVALLVFVLKPLLHPLQSKEC
jgi:hypothetical protein